MDHRNIDPSFLQKRLETIIEGLKEGVRREVERLRALGLPIYVDDNGKVVDLQTGRPPETPERVFKKPSAPLNTRQDEG